LKEIHSETHARQPRQCLRTRADFHKVYHATFVAERQPGYSVPNFGDPVVNLHHLGDLGERSLGWTTLIANSTLRSLQPCGWPAVSPNPTRWRGWLDVNRERVAAERRNLPLAR